MQEDIINGQQLIAAERLRQVEQEGWSEKDDDRYIQGELEDAADAYYFHAKSEHSPKPANWPWELEWWKPSNSMVRNYTKAGALYKAELDRLLRGKSKGPGSIEDMNQMINACEFAIDKIQAGKSKL